MTKKYQKKYRIEFAKKKDMIIRRMVHILLPLQPKTENIFLEKLQVKIIVETFCKTSPQRNHNQETKKNVNSNLKILYLCLSL